MTLEMALTVSRKIDAPAERLFDAWLTPETMRRFMAPGEGNSVLKATSDAKVGGRFEVLMKNEMGEIPHHGEYLAIDRPRRLSFTWNSPHSVEGSVVDITFEPQDGGTLVTLTHDRFKSEGARDGHEKGWSDMLRQLADIAG